jgi:WD40 repeat protein
MEQEVLAVAVRGDGQVATSGYETQVSWWDPKTAERLRKTGGPGVAVHELAFNAKDTVLAAAGGDGSVRFFEPKTGTAQKLAQVGSAVFAVALDSEGKRCATGAADGTVKLWDIADARLLVTLWSGASDNWLSLTPEGYVTGADTTLAKAVWKAAGKPVTDAKLLAPFADAAQVGKAAQGQKLAEPVGK